MSFKPRPLKYPPIFPLDKGLVLHLAFDDRSGAKAYDRSGKRNHGTVSGASWAAGRRGSTLNFDGSNDYVSVADSELMDFSNFTITCWIYPSGNMGSYRFIADRRETGKTETFYFAINPDEQLRLIIFNPYGGGSSIAVVVQNVWQFVAVVYDNTAGTIKFYVNSASNTVSGQTGVMPTSDSILCIGLDGDLVSYPFAGVINDLHIYNRALNAAEIKRLSESELMTPKVGG